MIKVYPEKIVIEMSIEQAKSLRHYLFGSYLKISDTDITNSVAVEALCGNESSKKAVDIRTTIIGCLDKALVGAREDYSEKSWNNAIRINI